MDRYPWCTLERSTQEVVPLTERDLSAKEVARVVNVSRRTVYRWLRAGLLDGYRTPNGRGEWRVRRHQLDRVRGLAAAEGAA